MGYRSFYIKNVDETILVKKLRAELNEYKVSEFSLIDEYSAAINLEREYFETEEGKPDFLMIRNIVVNNWIRVDYCNRSKLEKWGYALSKELNTEFVVVNVLWDAGYFYLSNYQNGEKLKEIEFFGLPNGPMAEFHDGDYSYIGVKLNYGENAFVYEDDLDSLLMKHDGYGHNIIEDYCEKYGIKAKAFFTEYPNFDDYFVLTTKKAKKRLEEKNKKYAEIRKKMNESPDDLPF